MYFSGYSRQGRVFVIRWDLKNPALVKERHLRSLPHSYVESRPYGHISLLCTQNHIRAALLIFHNMGSTSQWPNQSSNELLLCQNSGWYEEWKKLETETFIFDDELSNYHLLGPLSFDI